MRVKPTLACPQTPLDLSSMCCVSTGYVRILRVCTSACTGLYAYDIYWWVWVRIAMPFLFWVGSHVSWMWFSMTCKNRWYRRSRVRVSQETLCHRCVCVCVRACMCASVCVCVCHAACVRVCKGESTCARKAGQIERSFLTNEKIHRISSRSVFQSHCWPSIWLSFDGSKAKSRTWSCQVMTRWSKRERSRTGCSNLCLCSRPSCDPAFRTTFWQCKATCRNSRSSFLRSCPTVFALS